MTRGLRVLKEIVLTVGAIGGLACIALALASLLFGLTPLIVQSGSMEPTVPTGSLLVTRTTPASDLRNGDVVTVPRRDRTLVTHRIVNVAHHGREAVLQLKGDDNDVADPFPYRVKHAGVMVVSVPYAGHAAAWASSGLGLFLLGLYVAFLAAVVAADWRGRPRGAPGGGKRKTSMRVAAGAGVGVLLGGVMLGHPISPRPTAAAWTDDASAGTSTLSGYTVPKPVWVSCTVTGGALSQKTATIVWNEVSTPYALDYAAVINETGQNLTVIDNGTTRQVQFSAGLLSTVLNQTYNIRIRARLPSPNGSWTSIFLNQPVTITLLGLGMSCGTPS